MKISRIFSIAIAMLLLLAVFAQDGSAQAPAMVQVPIVTTIWGIPGTTYSGATAGTSTCTSTTPGWLAGTSASTLNGCPATQSFLQYLYGVAMDSAGDFAAAEASTPGVRVLYEGGSTMAKMITGALPGYSFTPVVGNVYTLTANTSSTVLTLQSNGQYYCNNTQAIGVALDQYEDGCPGQYVYTQARVVAFDPDGNLFIGADNPTNSVRVIYAGGVRAANLINAYNPTVAAAGGPKVGYVYALSNEGAANARDFVAIGGIGIQVVSATQENLFVSDRGTQENVTGNSSPQPLAATAGNQIKEFVCPTGTTGCNTSVKGTTYSSAGWATYIAGTTTASTNGDGGVATSALVDNPYEIYFDPRGDMFFYESGTARLRVIYNGGTTLKLYASGTQVTSPTVGYIYTVAGAGSSKASPATPITVAVLDEWGLDPNGNLYFAGNTGNIILWMENAQTGQVVAIGGMGALSSSYSANSSPQAGAYCNGLSSGPTMTDAYADGCPATETTLSAASNSLISFDAQGNFYIPEARTTSTASSVVRKYSFGSQFGSQATGSSSQQILAFTPSTSGGSPTYTPTEAFTSSEFSDAGNDVCTTETGIAATQTCTYNVTFKPALSGTRKGAVTLAQSGTTLATALLGGAGTGAQISLDPATKTTIGSGLQPTGVAVDGSGNVYISSGTSTGVVYKSTAGGTPASFATGLSNPAQVALDGAGNVYVADSANNRIATVSSAGGAASTFLGSTFSVLNNATVPGTILTNQSLSAPMGVAVDLYGNVYIADTGNNRVLEAMADINGLATQVFLLNFSGLSQPKGLAVDASGDIFVADSGNQRIVELSASGVQSVVSSGYTPTLASPVGVAIDAANNLYVADAGNQDVVLLPAGGSTATTLLTGSTSLTGVAADGAGDVYVSDAAAGYVTDLNRTSPSHNYTGSFAVGSSSSAYVVTLTNTGSAGSSLTFGSPLVTQSDPLLDFVVNSGTGNGCTSTLSLSPGQQCTLSAIFEPQSISPATSAVTFPSSSAVNSASLTLSGAASQLELTYKLLSPGTVTGTVNTQLIATVSTNTNSTLTGTVTFIIDGGTPIPVSVANGAATTTVALAAGSHTVTANYNGGDGNTLTFVVVPGISTLALTYTPAAPAFGQSVVVTATITTTNATQTPTGTVTFQVNGVPQTPVAYAPQLQITLNMPPVGATSVSASYSGDSNYSPTSNTTSVNVGKASTGTSLQVTPNVSAGGDTITLTATVSPQFSIPPTGSVVFAYAGTTTNAVPLVNGSASYTTTTSQLSGYTFTATYSGDNNYQGSNTTVTPKPTYVETLTPSSLNVSQNSVGTVNVQFDPFFGYAGGNIQVSCTNLPDNLVCATVPRTGTTLGTTTSQSIQLQVVTNASPQAVQSAGLTLPRSGGRMLIGGLIGLSLLLLLPLRRQRRRFIQLVVVILMLGVAVGMSACGSNTINNAIYQTPTGTYSLNVSATDGTITTSQTLSLTVLQGTTAARPSVLTASSK